jgi:hypothetical protein
MPKGPDAFAERVGTVDDGHQLARFEKLVEPGEVSVRPQPDHAAPFAGGQPYPPAAAKMPEEQLQALASYRRVRSAGT